MPLFIFNSSTIFLAYPLKFCSAFVGIGDSFLPMLKMVYAELTQ